MDLLRTWWRVHPEAKLGSVLLAVVVGVVAGGIAAFGHQQPGGGVQSTPAAASPTVSASLPGAAATTTPAPTPIRSTPAPASEVAAAIAVGKAFLRGYLEYDWQHPPAHPADPIRPYATDRVYATIASGAAPNGLSAPWVKIAPSLHETLTLAIGDVSAESTGPSIVVLQAHVTEAFRTDNGQGQVTRMVNLRLTNDSGAWLIDWVEEGPPDR